MNGLHAKSAGNANVQGHNQHLQHTQLPSLAHRCALQCVTISVLTLQTTYTEQGSAPPGRRHKSAALRALKAGFNNLPEPENNIEIIVPEDKEEEASRPHTNADVLHEKV